MKTCNKCKTQKEESKFRVREGRAIAECGDCERERSKNNYHQNAEKYKINSTKWKQENKERVRKNKALWAVNNPEKIAKHNRNKYLKDPKKYIDRALNWARNNPDKKRAQIDNRIARIYNNGGSYTAEEWNELKKKYDYTCLSCGKREPEIKLTFDHVKPISKGGKNNIENAQPLCLSCNSSKKDKEIDYRRNYVQC